MGKRPLWQTRVFHHLCSIPLLTIGRRQLLNLHVLSAWEGRNYVIVLTVYSDEGVQAGVRALMEEDAAVLPSQSWLAQILLAKAFTQHLSLA